MSDQENVVKNPRSSKEYILLEKWNELPDENIHNQVKTAGDLLDDRLIGILKTIRMCLIKLGVYLYYLNILVVLGVFVCFAYGIAVTWTYQFYHFQWISATSDELRDSHAYISCKNKMKFDALLFNEDVAEFYNFDIETTSEEFESGVSDHLDRSLTQVLGAHQILIGCELAFALLVYAFIRYHTALLDTKFSFWFVAYFVASHLVSYGFRHVGYVVHTKQCSWIFSARYSEVYFKLALAFMIVGGSYFLFIWRLTEKEEKKENGVSRKRLYLICKRIPRNNCHSFMLYRFLSLMLLFFTVVPNLILGAQNYFVDAGTAIDWIIHVVDVGVATVFSLYKTLGTTGYSVYTVGALLDNISVAIDVYTFLIQKCFKNHVKPEIPHRAK